MSGKLVSVNCEDVSLDIVSPNESFGYTIIITGMKQPRLQDLLIKTRTKASLIPNLNHETRKIRIRT